MLPCEPTEDNLPRIKEYILNRYASSAFNCCEQQPLPLMKDSPPLRLFVDKDAKPVSVFTPSQVPLHWTASVKAGLDRDKKLGVIEKCPVNTPAQWTSRMVVTAKATGEPRRTVDFQAVNNHAPRQTHHTKSPWAIASSVPSGKVKTVLDCYHGYHSVPIDPSYRDFTCFLTPRGRYRYITSPQGFISAGDGYSQRMHMIIGDFPDFEKCIDDTIIWDDSVADNFGRVCQFLTRCSLAGCMFNPEKFQFGEKTLKYLGFMISKTGLTPTIDFLNSIQNLPTPTCLTDVISWFGAVNQVLYAFAQATLMRPFRHLLSSKVPFSWSEELDAAFEASKQEIVCQCEKGVSSFSLTAPTAVPTEMLIMQATIH